LDTKCILLSAAWVDEEAWREFMCYPEVLFIEFTHGTNNESHLLLNLVGKNSNGKVFPLVRIFMPNETASFYWCVLPKALPILIGKENLARVIYLMSDGNSQEFNMIDEGIYQYLLNAKRGQYAYHIVQKTWEAKLPKNNGCFEKPDEVESLTKAIKPQWIYSWMNGSGCYMDYEYTFSKEMLMHVLQTNKQVLDILGKDGS
jgi:hypothetical protein